MVSHDSTLVYILLDFSSTYNITLPPSPSPSPTQTLRLLDEEGVFVGGSSGLNVEAAVNVAKELGPGHTIVTALCDGGEVSHRMYVWLYVCVWICVCMCMCVYMYVSVCMCACVCVYVVIALNIYILKYLIPG